MRGKKNEKQLFFFFHFARIFCSLRMPVNSTMTFASWSRVRFFRSFFFSRRRARVSLPENTIFCALAVDCMLMINVGFSYYRKEGGCAAENAPTHHETPFVRTRRVLAVFFCSFFSAIRHAIDTTIHVIYVLYLRQPHFSTILMGHYVTYARATCSTCWANQFN